MKSKTVAGRVTFDFKPRLSLRARPAGVAALACASVLGVPLEVRAQSVADSSESNLPALEEVVVNARRREENAQTVPIAITVVSQEALSDNNVFNFNDLQYLVPSLTVQTSALSRDSLNVSIRGQGGNGNTGLPAVVAYLNEVPIPTDKDGNLLGGPGLLFDLENVQVLKGPQGTLFGRNAIGGALLLQSARPKNDLGGTAQISYGNHDDRELDAAVDLPVISDVLLTRIAFNGQLRDGYTFLQSEPGHPTGIDTDNRDYWSTRGTVTYKPTDSFQNDTILTYQKYSNRGSPAHLVDCNPNAAFQGAFPTLYATCTAYAALPPRTVGPVDDHLQVNGTLLALSNISRFAINDNLAVRNILGYDRAFQELQLDLDWTNLPLLDITYKPRDQTFHQISDELQLSGSSFGGQLEWIAGGFYLEQIPPDELTVQAAIILGGDNDSAYRQGDRTKAIFAQGTYDLSPVVNGLKLTLGGRYSRDDHFLESYGGLGGSICTPPTVLCSTRSYIESNRGTPTWNASLDYALTDKSLLYATVRRGFRDGGANTDVGAPPFGPEFVTDVELGVKSDWNGSIPVRTNADFYYQKYSDIQVPQLFTTVTGVPETVTGNAASAKLLGFEFDGLAQLSRALQVGATFDYLNFQYTSFGPGVDSVPLIAAETDNRPRFKYGLNARYLLPVPRELGEVTLRADYHGQSRSGDFTGAAGVTDPAVRAYSLVNMTLNWASIAGSAIDATLFVSNLTDRLYVNGGQQALGVYGTAVRYGEPRMYGIRLRYSFGSEAGRPH